MVTGTDQEGQREEDRHQAPLNLSECADLPTQALIHANPSPGRQLGEGIFTILHRSL